jgi:hypothetical protein
MELALSSLRHLMVAHAANTRMRICCATRGDGGLQKLSALGGCVDRVLGDMEVAREGKYRTGFRV